MTPQGQGTGDKGHDGEHDTPMTGMYVAVIVLEAAIIAALWVLGRIYS